MRCKEGFPQSDFPKDTFESEDINMPVIVRGVRNNCFTAGSKLYNILKMIDCTELHHIFGYKLNESETETIKGAIEKDQLILSFFFLTGSHFLYFLYAPWRNLMGGKMAAILLASQTQLLEPAVKRDITPQPCLSPAWPCLVAKVGRLRLTHGALLMNQEHKWSLPPAQKGKGHMPHDIIWEWWWSLITSTASDL